MTAQVSGDEQTILALDLLRENLREGIRKGLLEAAEKVITTAKEGYVPVRYGWLRASGYTEPLEDQEQSIVVELGFGKEGPSRDYALFVHERPARHEVGQDKFLEIPAFEAGDLILDELKAAVQESTGLK